MSQPATSQQESLEPTSTLMLGRTEIAADLGEEDKEEPED